jgi:hypothetical protein
MICVGAAAPDAKSTYADHGKLIIIEKKTIDVSFVNATSSLED